MWAIGVPVKRTFVQRRPCRWADGPISPSPRCGARMRWSMWAGLLSSISQVGHETGRCMHRPTHELQVDGTTVRLRRRTHNHAAAPVGVPDRESAGRLRSVSDSQSSLHVREVARIAGPWQIPFATVLALWRSARGIVEDRLRRRPGRGVCDCLMFIDAGGTCGEHGEFAVR